MLQKKTLYIPFTFLLIIATVQLALVSRMVAFLHIQKTEVGTYRILSNTTSSTDGSINGGGFDLHVLPEKLSLNQGHVTNGAAGYGMVMSIVSLVACVFLRSDAYQKSHKSILLTLTIALSLLVLFILAAFTYVAAVTYLTIDNKIDLDIVRATASAGPGSAAAAYSIDSWTPETWYQALVLLLLDESTKSSLSAGVSEMVAWRAWITLYLIVAAVVLGWNGMAYLREWRRVCGCGLGSGIGAGIGVDRAEEEELVTYRVGSAEGVRK
ncbi:hypothetical protein ZTR_11119 [Talaromyces verruculosus]|nr:hypothetical protein ZTR_11119 [Talaromyces verruculosus]